MKYSSVSVVIPAFNVDKYILGTINSILNQTQPVGEIIVVEDCSTDKTSYLLEQNFGDTPNIKLIHNTVNRGLCASRNIGIRAVNKNTDFVMLVDADDLIAPYSVEILSRALLRSQDDYGMAFGSILFINELNLVRPNPNPIPASIDITLEALAEQNLIGSGTGALIKNRVFSELIFEESLRDGQLEGCGDWLFYLLVRSKFKIKYIDKPTVGYRIVDGNMSSNKVQMLKSLMKIQALASQRVPIDLRKSFQKGYFHLGTIYTEQAIGRRNMRELIEILLVSRNFSNTMFLSLMNRVARKFIQGTFRKLKGVNHNYAQPLRADFYDYCDKHSHSNP